MNTFHSHRKHQQKSAGRSTRVSSESIQASPLTSFRSIALGSGCTLVFGLLFLLLFTWIASRTSDPNSLIIPLSLVALYMTALSAGFITIRISRISPLICGLVSGAILLLVCFLIGLGLTATGTSPQISALVLRLPTMLFSAIGAHLGKKNNRRGKSRRK